MAKAPPSSKRPKRAKAAHPSDVHKKVGSAHKTRAGKTVVSRAGKTMVEIKGAHSVTGAGKTMVEVQRVLGDIREQAGKLSAGADRLLRRV